MNAGQATGEAAEGVLLVTCSWDSGPYGTYSPSDRGAPEIEGPGGCGRNTVPIPKAVWRRYERAERELREAEDALQQAADAALATLRKSDPRFNPL